MSFNGPYVDSQQECDDSKSVSSELFWSKSDQILLDAYCQQFLD